MADKLKDLFGETFVVSIAQDIQRVDPAFEAQAFVASAMKGLGALELIARGRHVCEALRRHLPDDFEAASKVLVASLGPELGRTDAFGFAPFRYLPYVYYSALYGLDHFEAAMRLQYEVTKRFSSEYSIRAFLVRHPDATYARLHEWASDPSVHVRRLVSEGTRPRLPWAPRLPAYQKDPAPVLRLLEILKDDPELYVRRSVANNLNDIGKDHPDVLVDVCRRWSRGASEERRWVISHALRSLVKGGHRPALDVLGFAARPSVRIDRVAFSHRRLRVGGTLAFSLELVSASRAPQDLLADYVVHFVKANGSTAPKVFKLRQVTLPPRGRAPLAGRVSFKPMTTRRHYPGVHRFELLLNGVSYALGEVRVVL